MKFKFCSKYLFVILPLVLVIFLAGCGGGGLITPATDEAMIKVDILAVDKSPVDTDLPDYSPGDYVLVTGSGWIPGETVKLDFLETLSDLISQQTITYYTVADSEGNISDSQYLIELRHLGATFILTATGQTSGLVATTTFTDAWPKYDMTIVSGDSQSADVGSVLAPFVVLLKKQEKGEDHPVPQSGVTVTWAIITVPTGATGHSLTATSTSTDSDGKTSSTLTLGNKPGTYEIEATWATGSTSVTFTATAPLPVPTLLSPADGATVTTAIPTLDWSDVTNDPLIVKYKVEVSGPTTWTSGWFTGSQVTTPALSDGAYSWRVQAKDSATPSNYSGWSGVWTFIVATIPPDTTAPTGSITINSDATYTNDTSVTLNLEATDAVGVTGYRVANGTDASVADTVTVTSTTNFSDDISWTLPTVDGTKTVAVQYCDAAGNWSDNYTDSIILDQTAPVIVAGTLSGTEGLDGWWRSAVTVAFSATDNLSGFAPGGALSIGLDPKTTDGEGTDLYVTSDGISDLAGNSAVGIQVGPFKGDWTTPVVTINVPGEDAHYILGDTVLADWTAEDAISGIASVDGDVPSGSAIDTGTIGSQTFTVTATDNAGNETVETVTYTVIYGFFGLLDPYSPTKVYKAGSTIPLKWQYTDADGNVVDSSLAIPRVRIVDTGDDPPLVTGEPILVEDPGKSGLRYDPLTMTWQFNWQTKKGAPGIYYIYITSAQTGQVNGPYEISLR